MNLKISPKIPRFIVHVIHVCILVSYPGMKYMNIWSAMGYLRIMKIGIFIVTLHYSTPLMNNHNLRMKKGMIT